MTAAQVAGGERLIGVRLGGPVTRRAPWRLADGAPELGWLTGPMRLPAGQPVPGRLASPHAVPHLAVVLGGQLTGPGVSPAGALAAVASVHAAVELAGRDGGPAAGAGGDPEPAGLAGGVAGRFLVSPAGRPVASLDLALEACLVEVDGQIIDSGTGAAAAGHPAEALAWAANTLDSRGLALEPGWLVLTGPLTAPVPLPPGAPLAVHFTTLGSLFLPQAEQPAPG
jgi:2-oxo-3-hexenedioate decarboxylase